MYGGTPLNYNSATDDGGYVSNGDGDNYRDWYTGDTRSSGDSGDSGGSTGLLTLLGLGLLTLRRKK
jgi:MYXO-CTERM domain-containing protein